MNKVLLGDCLVESDKIESGSVDLILTDLPYGTVKNIGNSETVKHGMQGKTEWDSVIDTNKIYEVANRILRKNGKMVLFAQQPFTNELISNTIPNIPFSYSMIWEKDHFANALTAKKAPLNYYEDVLVFSKTHDFEGLHPLREYALKIKEYTNYSRLRFKKILGHYGFQHFLEGDKTSSQFSLCTKETYLQLIKEFRINNLEGFLNYSELERVNKKYESTFNLWEGKKYKSNILKYKKDYQGLHPTQKPVLLLEDLIKTFSNEGDLVVDLTAGSGSTAIACLNTKRNYVVIEKDVEYYDTIINRIKTYHNQPIFF